jgi:hypothetical protein
VYTQWRTAGVMGVRIGLDYPAVYQTADVMGIELIPSVLTKIRALENYELERQHMEGGGASCRRT